MVATCESEDLLSDLAQNATNQAAFDERYGKVSKFKKSSRKIKMDGAGIGDLVKGFVPILQWLPEYNIKRNLIGDIVGGLTVGIMHVPQGMAYSSLAGVRPVNGLYTSLLPAIFYMIFGTSRHVSLGVFAVVSLMSGSCQLRVLDEILAKENNTDFGSTDLLDDSIYAEHMYNTSVSILAALTMLVGIFQISMALLRLDFLMSFLSDQIIAGFTTGAAVHVFVAQLNKVLGVHLPRHSGFGKLYFVCADLVQSVLDGKVNYVTLVLSLFVIAGLFFVKDFVDPIIKKKFKLPVPYELFVMIIGTVVSALFQLHEKYAVKIIGEIPTGIPLPSVPNVSYFPLLIQDALAIAVVSLVITISMGKLFAKKHNYKVDTRQEFYAVGLVETGCSFFPVWPASTSLARSLVYEAAGTQTQLATVFSSLLLLAVIYFIGPFVQVLPTCFLACIIIVALKGMFMQLKALPVLWTVSKTDFAIFVVAFLSTVILDVVEGLIIGVAFALGLLIQNIQRTHLRSVGKIVDETGQKHYCETNRYREASADSTVQCVQFASPLVFINIEQFNSDLESILLSSRNELKSVQECGLEMGTKYLIETPRIIVDLSKTTLVDYSGAQCIIEVLNPPTKSDAFILISGALPDVLGTIRSMPTWKDSMEEKFFPSIHECLTHLGNNRQQ